MRIIQERQFKTKISLISAILLGIGSTMGAGIYILLSPAIRMAGPAVIFAFLLNGFIALIIAGNYASAASFTPIEGGGFRFVEEAYGRGALFIGWIAWLGNMSYIAFLSVAFAKFLSQLLLINEIVLAIIILIIFTAINILGTTKVALIGSFVTVFFVTTLLITAGYIYLNPQGSGSIPFFPEGGLSILQATSLLFVAFTGFELIVSISAEIKNPKKNVPKALILSVVIVLIIYLIIIFAVIFATNLSAISGTEIALLSAVESSLIIQIILISGFFFAILSSINITIMASSRNVYALASDKFLPDFFSKISPKFQSPIRGILLSSGLTALIVLSNQVTFIASITNLSFMIIISSVGFANLKLRKYKGEEVFKLPLHPLGPILCIILPLLLIPFLELNSFIIGGLWLLIGVLIYLFTNKNNTQAEPPEKVISALIKESKKTF